jgi:hypothetical protein
MTRAALIVVVLAGCVAGCREREAPARGAERAPRALLLRHVFRQGLELRYESTTVERGVSEVTITMRTRWRVARVTEGGAAELEAEIERYEQRVFPRPAETSATPDPAALGRALEGARFLLRVSPDGRRIEHLGHEGLPALSDFAVRGIEASLASHVLKLPVEPVHDGQRWSVEAPAASAGDAAAAPAVSRSQWRVLSIRQRDGADTFVELVCLATIEPPPRRVGGRAARDLTEFHYAYLWNATDGVLDSLTSTGSTTTTTAPPPDGGRDGGGEPETRRTSFEARLRLLGSAPVGR